MFLGGLEREQWPEILYSVQIEGKAEQKKLECILLIGYYFKNEITTCSNCSARLGTTPYYQEF